MKLSQILKKDDFMTNSAKKDFRAILLLVDSEIYSTSSEWEAVEVAAVAPESRKASRF